MLQSAHASVSCRIWYFNFIVQEFSGFFKPGMNCTFSGLYFFLCGWGGEISFQMLSDNYHIICRFIICNIERWGKNFNKLIFFLSFFKHALKEYILKKTILLVIIFFLVTRTMFFFRIFFYNFNKM